jgi:hypothetical protein
MPLGADLSNLPLPEVLTEMEASPTGLTRRGRVAGATPTARIQEERVTKP